MKKDHAAKRKNTSIKVPGSGEEFLVEGFAGAYEEFLEEKPSRRPQQDSSGALVIMLGGFVTLVGVSGALFDFGSSEGTRILCAVGALVSIAGMKLQRDAMGVPPEEFLSSEYDPTGEDGVRLGGTCFEYLGESRFLVR